MKKLKSYTHIWNVEKMLYSISNLELPFAVSFTQITWFVMSLMVVIIFGKVPPLSYIPLFIRYAIPVAFTIIMNQRVFDGKKPYNFIKTVLLYLVRPKISYAYQYKSFKRHTLQEEITIVRSEYHNIEISS